MADYALHLRLAKEKREGALEELGAGRYSNTADLALKAAEQAIEAAASKRNIHFHAKPRTAHIKRFEWLEQNVPAAADAMRILWDAYGRLGYLGEDSERARRAVEAMEAILRELRNVFGIEVT